MIKALQKALLPVFLFSLGASALVLVATGDSAPQLDVTMLWPQAEEAQSF